LATAQDILLLHPQQVEFSFTFEIQVSHGTWFKWCELDRV
jgi:hypothetical protein